jgi:MFS family permease
MMRLNQDQQRLLYNGAAWALYESVTAGFLIAFALALGASNTVVGILGALPYIATLLMEIPGAKLVEYARRKTIYVIATSVSRCGWLLVLLSPYLFKEQTLWFVGGFFFLLRCLEYLADPAWTSWAADLVPDKIRGAFWGRRNMLVSLAGMLGTVAAGTYLDLFPKESTIGFATLFGAGILVGLWSTRIMVQTKEPEYRDHVHHGFKAFFHIDGQFRAYCWIMVAYNFAVMIASPFFTVYMLHNLGLSYTYFVLAGALATASRILAHPHFGYVSDRVGDKPVALICMLGTALIPFFFAFVTRETVWLVVPIQIVSGIVWAGTELTTWNLLLDLTRREKRALQVAEYNLLNSVPMIVAPILGGLIADNVTLILSGIPLIFVMASILRVLAALLMTRIHETRVGAERPVGEVFAHVITVHPFHGIERVIKVVVKRVQEEFTHIHPSYPVKGRVQRIQQPRA